MSSLLISGKANTLSNLGNPVKLATHEEAISMFGENDLTDAYMHAKRIGVSDIWLLNLQEQNDHIDFVEILENVNVDYFAPIDIYVNSSFYDLISKQYVTYLEDYINRTSDYAFTSIIYTYKHASLYEDIDAYIQDNVNAYERVCKKVSATPYGSQAMFVLNNLMDYPYANVVLASILATTNVLDYPTSKRIGHNIFDLSIEDIGDREMIYFRRNVENVIAPENLLNFAPIEMPTKNVMTERLIRHIDNELGLDKYIGRLYRPYIQSLIKTDLQKKFEGLKKKGFVLDFEIISVDFVKERNYTYTVKLNVDLVIPFTTERINMNFEGVSKDG